MAAWRGGSETRRLHMGLRAVQFLAVLITALALVPTKWP
jgi:hypothetical protein